MRGLLCLPGPPPSAMGAAPLPRPRDVFSSRFQSRTFPGPPRHRPPGHRCSPPGPPPASSPSRGGVSLPPTPLWQGPTGRPLCLRSTSRGPKGRRTRDRAERGVRRRQDSRGLPGAGVGRRGSGSRGGRCSRRGRRMGRSWGAGRRGRRGLKGRRGEVAFPPRLAIGGAPTSAYSSLPPSCPAPPGDLDQTTVSAGRTARRPDSGRPGVLGRQERACGTRASFPGLRGARRLQTRSLLSSADVETLARARAGGGRLGPRRGRRGAEESELGPRGLLGLRAGRVGARPGDALPGRRWEFRSLGCAAVELGQCCGQKCCSRNLNL